ncbi:hypothetical protein [Caldimonas thermodepolymerans]|uniref:hypothetical protein n=1 Tax=Caldimonas thermodepolymerans TaxID=215580 RepID=UPI0022365CED|nr:hypothetical protein [Caldimonas thermodepolymerans]UZG45487.1 hypothetical protein ONZ46_05915 [Caldimonas thermodepolymerans]
MPHRHERPRPRPEDDEARRSRQPQARDRWQERTPGPYGSAPDDSWPRGGPDRDDYGSERDIEASRGSMGDYYTGGWRGSPGAGGPVARPPGACGEGWDGDPRGSYDSRAPDADERSAPRRDPFYRGEQYGGYQGDPGPRGRGPWGGPHETRYGGGWDEGRGRAGRGSGGYGGQSYDERSRGTYGQNYGGSGDYQGYTYEGQRHLDPDYHQWRTEQMRALDEDYHQWRQERYRKFSEEFDQWRRARQQQPAGTAAASSGSDSSVGTGTGTSGTGQAGSDADTGHGAAPAGTAPRGK